MDNETAIRVLRVKMWEKGHPFEEVDGMNLEDVGDVIAFWHENNQIDARRNRMRGNLKRGK
ncbi:MAG TPA: hypothetical protein ENI05_14380 [Porticoccus sp.]|nr:hypothetical protein [Porticoccus sp.]